MEISQTMLLLLLIYSFLWGGAVGAMFDVCVLLRTLIGVGVPRRQYKKLCALKLPITKRSLCAKEPKVIAERIFAALSDLICVLLATAGLIVLSYSYNRGTFRGFTVLGALVGIFFYRRLFSKLFFFVLEPIVLVLKYAILSFFLLCLYPVIKSVEFLIKNVKKITSLYTFALEKKRKKLYNIKEEVFLHEGERRVVVGLASRRNISEDPKRRTDDGE